MDDILVNKYLGQFNPILIVPVLSAVVGAILVFVFGFKRPSEPRFQSTSSSDTLKKSKKKNVGQNARSADLVSQTSSTSSKAQNNNATPQKSNKLLQNKRKDDKKTDDKKTDGTPVKKPTQQKKSARDSPNATAANKKQKAGKKTAVEEREQKPADFDEGDWFTVQSKGSKKVNKTDETAPGVNGETSSPKIEGGAKNKLNRAKIGRVEKAEKSADKKNEDAVATETPVTNLKPTPAEVIGETPATAEIKVEVPPVAPSVDAPVTAVTQPAVDEQTVPISEKKEEIPAKIKIREEKPIAANTVPAPPVVDDAAYENSAIAFDELGEWTDAKPDRKRGNKKKSRKD